MIRKADTENELIESIAQEILNYLKMHPNSVDSIDGIAKWWLKRQRFDEAHNNVQLAVGLLISEGKLEKRGIGRGGAVFYARKHAEFGDSKSATFGDGHGGDD